jgi:uncharacterized iron-regulated membrane protein
MMSLWAAFFGRVGSATLRDESRPVSRKTSQSLRFHGAALWLHRYVGLVIATFLLVAGLTGSIIAFYVPLDAALNPELFKPERPSRDAPLLDAFELRERLDQQLPASTPKQHTVMFVSDPERSISYWVNDGQDERQVFVNPYTGAIMGARRFGDLSEGKKGLLSFVYRLHFSLGLGRVGTLLFGIVAVLWTLDCFVGMYLTFPPPRTRQPAPGGKSWWSRWWRAWLLKTNQLFALVFTWHRASGLWIWMMLLVFAWSGVALNLDNVYTPVMAAIFGAASEPELPALNPPRTEPPVPMRDAYAKAKQLMAAEAQHRGFEIYRENYFAYKPEHAAYTYKVYSSLDISERLAETSLTIDAAGQQLAFHAPGGQQLGDIITHWLIALHFGSVRVGGLAYRSFVCLCGLLVAALSITGVWIWWRKRSLRRKRATQGT